ncbi:phage tail protein [Cedecea davisae]|uniref:phage tail protein n=1 Tax=Cedecea davisae TaxID=158484 RepID=UPI00209E507A|nr:phage tail protein [Cedecea davisae]
MSQKFKTILTNAGVKKLAAGLPPDGKKVVFTTMAVGDGGGTLPEPKPEQTALVREVWRAAINTITPHPKYANCVVAELLIPPEVGGFWTRELGLYDESGELIAVSNMAESYKPLLSEGSGRAQAVRMVIAVSNLASVELQIDSSTVTATKDYVDDAIDKHAKSRNHPDATLKEKGFVQLSSATDSDSETLAATPKAVKAAVGVGNAANQNAERRLLKDSNLVDVPDKVSARKNMGLGTAAQYDAATFLNAWNNLWDLPDKNAARLNLGLGDIATHSAKEFVPVVRKINDKDLSRDIKLTAGDVGALTQSDGDARYVNVDGDTMSGDLSMPNLTAGTVTATNGTMAIRATFDGTNQYARLFLLDADAKIVLANIEADFSRNLVFNINGRRFVMDRNGNMFVPGGVYDAGQRVFSPNYLPTANQIGALPIGGGTLGGPLLVKGQISTDEGYNVYASQDVIAGNGGVYEGGKRVYSPNNPQPLQDLSSYAQSVWVMQNFVSDVMLGAEAFYDQMGAASTWTFHAPAGCVMTGMVARSVGSNSAHNIGGIYYKPTLISRNGTWVQIGG